MRLDILALFLISEGEQENTILNYVVRVGFNKEMALEEKNLKEIKEIISDCLVGVMRGGM